MNKLKDFFASIGRPSAAFDKFLILKLNPYTGKRFWKVTEILGLVLFIAYMALVLPLLGASMNIGFIGAFTEPGEPAGIIGYAGLVTFHNDWYYLTCMFGIAAAMIGVLLFENSQNYRKGLLYQGNGDWVTPDGKRHKKGFFRGFGLS